MSRQADGRGQVICDRGEYPPPRTGQQIATHAIVGVSAAVVTAKALGKQITHGYAIVAAIIAMVAHAWLDAPLAQFLAGLGFSF